MPPRDVGVTIALRQRSEGARENAEIRDQQQNFKEKARQPAVHRKWWQDLLYGLSIYLGCIYLPFVYRILKSICSRIFMPLLGLIMKRLGDDAAFSDLWVVFSMSTSLAILRVILIQRMVDMQSASNVEAMVRCKSIHLLSAAYQNSMSPAAKPRKMKKIKSGTTGFLPSLPLLDKFERNSDIKDLASVQTPKMTRSDSWLESTWETVRPLSDLLVKDDSRLHAAPRYATAVFRCLYISVSIATAWFGFSNADFWPPAVGGTGMTKRCWNLKGSPGIEEDFDELNGLLKFYYLLQASYHLHSGAFHVLTLVILWVRSKKAPKEEANSSKKKPFIAYWRSVSQHGLALVLIGGSYLFASTRRLGAIGSFCLDASSLLLHILQVCINAPYTISPMFIKSIHYGLVIPFFIYCRFFVWPFVVWKSAWLESKDWLRQMESTMFPGIYRAMLWVFTLLTVILLSLNVILLKRLINHPHLQRVYSKSSNLKEAK